MILTNKIKFSGTDLARKKFLVGISFDDGPHSDYTPKVLKILERFKIQATFFWIADNAVKLKSREPDVFKKIVLEIKSGGHEVGLHAPYDYQPRTKHRLFGKFSKEEMENSKETIEKLTNLSVHLYRPHYLQLGRSISFARELGMTTVLGDFIHYTAPDAEKEIQARKFSGVKPAKILVFHDGVSVKTTKNRIVEVLPIVFENLKKKGIRGTKISDIL